MGGGGREASIGNSVWWEEGYEAALATFYRRLTGISLFAAMLPDKSVLERGEGGLFLLLGVCVCVVVAVVVLLTSLQLLLSPMRERKRERESRIR